MVYLDPKNDITFKKVFAERPHLLLSFLNAMLPLPDDSPIVSLEYLSSEVLPGLPELKSTTVDIRCRNAKGWQFLVEMQMLWTNHFKRRILYNVCKAFAHQISKGQHYDVLQPVYALSIINQGMDVESGLWYHHYRLTHHALPLQYMRGIEFVFLELPNFNAENFAQRHIQALWMQFLKTQNGSTMIPSELMEVPEIAEAVDVLKDTSYTREELEQYEKYWDIVRSQQALVQDAKAKGREEGKEEGIEIGKEMGMNASRTQIALKLKSLGYPVDAIATATGLSPTEIEALVLE